jgi:hypothetical protein
MGNCVQKIHPESTDDLTDQSESDHIMIDQYDPKYTDHCRFIADMNNNQYKTMEYIKKYRTKDWEKHYALRVARYLSIGDKKLMELYVKYIKAVVGERLDRMMNGNVCKYCGK